MQEENVNIPAVNRSNVNTPVVNNPINTCSSEMTIDDVEKPYHPSSSFNFPKAKCGKQDRSCQASWFSKYPWLHYDARFVYMLMHFLV